MLCPEVPDNEHARLHRLRALNLLDGAAESAIDAFTRLATGMTGMPIGLVSLVDEDRQWFKSSVGCIPQGGQTGRDVSFCGHAILDSTLFEVEDARIDPRFHDNPLVTGEPYVVHYAGAPLVMPGGEHIGTLCLISQDPGRLDDRERFLLSELAQMLVGLMLLREQDKAQCRAEQAANQAKSDFLATMSHEIRTPINGVIGLTSLLGMTQLPEPARGYVKLIDGCAQTLLTLVDDVLDVSKIEAGQLTLETLDIDLHALLKEQADLQRVRAREKQIAFSHDCAPDVPRWIQGDPHRLKQILANLLGNAWKFTDRGSYSLSARVRAGAYGPQLQLVVRDSGIGIAPEHQAKLFTRFTQADASTTRRFRGTGLGLAIVKQLTQLMGGEVTLASLPEVGSTFTVTLPLQTAARTVDASSCGAGPAAAASGKRLLVVDDNDINLLVAQGLLGTLGYADVTLARDGAEAVRLCESNSYDVVLMDCQMPEMDGYAATRALRGRGLHMPVIALTASARAQDRERCLAAGMTDYLTKPVGIEQLTNAVQRAVQEVDELRSQLQQELAN